MSLFQFNVAGLYAGGTAPYSPSFESLASHSLEGVQSAQLALVYPHQDTFSWDGAGDQVLVDRPRAELTFSYIFASGVNERNLGFVTSQSGTTPALSAMNGERNYYLAVNQAGQNEVGYAGTDSYILALGNGNLTKYDFSAQVGQPSTVNVTVQGLNLLVQPSGTNQPLPAIGKQSGSATTGLYTLSSLAATVSNYFEAAPSAITLTFDTGCAMGVLLSGQNACPLESFSFSIDMSRAEVKEMGWAYPNTRPIQWPITIGIRANARLSQFQYDALNRYGCPGSGYNFSVGFKSDCTHTDSFSFQFKDAKLQSETIGLSVGGGTAQASFDWSIRLFDINRTSAGSPNFYINTSGTPYSSIIFPQVDYVSGSAPLTFTISTPSFLSIVSGPGILSGNSVFVTDTPDTVVVRARATDGSDTQDVTVTVG